MSQNKIMFNKEETLFEIRNRILNAILITFSVYLLFVVPISFLRIYYRGWGASYFIQLAIFALILGATIFRKHLSYKVRLGTLFVFFVFIGSFGFVSFGLISPAIGALILLPILSAMLGGRRMGLITLLVSTVIVTVIAFLTVQQYITYNFNLGTNEFAPVSWIMVGGVLLMFSGMIIIGLHMLFEKLSNLIDNLEKKVEKRTKELKLQNKIISKKNKENEFLLKEIHHRIKNNLITVISILNLQKTRIDSSEIQEIFEECEHRILAMSKIHDMISLSESFGHLDSKKYFTELAKELVTNLSVGIKVKLELDVDEVNLDSKTLYSLGIIINECITNSFKHAFFGKNNGTIKLTFKKTSTGQFNMFISDNGIGIDSNKTSDKKSLGSLLIDTFVKQLKGSIEVNHEKGTEVRIVFKQLDQF